MDNGLNLNFNEENICPRCGSKNVTSTIENLSDDENLQNVSKFCNDCKSRWGYIKDLQKNTISKNRIFF